MRQKITLTSEHGELTYGVFIEGPEGIKLTDVLEWFDHYAINGIGYRSPKEY